jgi:hypothetical protein
MAGSQIQTHHHPRMTAAKEDNFSEGPALLPVMHRVQQ